MTVRVCDRTIGPRSRTHDQMVQAARPWVQNIAEGSKASGTSAKMELKLTNVGKVDRNGLETAGSLASAARLCDKACEHDEPRTRPCPAVAGEDP